MLNVIYAECLKYAHCAGCRYAECLGALWNPATTLSNAYAECRDAGCRNKLNLKSIVMLSVKAFQE